ncbi:MAG: heavy metal translocating P-type ATPase [Bacillota bacterium]
MAPAGINQTNETGPEIQNTCYICCSSCTAGQARVREGDRGRLPVIVAAGLLFAAGLVFSTALRSTGHAWAEYLILLAAYVLVGGRIILEAFKGLLGARVFDENFLMTVATFCAIAIRQVPEAVAVMLFYSIGEYLQELAAGRSRRSITALLEIRPDYANLKTDGETLKVRPEEVQVGQSIIVRPGERVPLDGEIVKGTSFVDTSALTGESVPRKVKAGENILAGTVNGPGLLEVRVTRPAGESSIARILDLVKNAAARKAPTEQFITTFARYYSPAMVLGAAATAVIPSLVVPEATFSEWVYRALVLLVISCPCALVVSIPLSYFGGLGGASRNGILIKGGNFLEALTRLHTVVFDKTGTLTRGVFKVSTVVPRNGYRQHEVLRLAAAVESGSNHPIARSIIEAYGQEATANALEDFREIAGCGVKARMEGRMVLAGNGLMLHRENVPHDDCDITGTVVYVAVDGILAGYIVISDEVKQDAAETISALKRLGIKKTVMLTGDDEASARQVAAVLGIDTYFARLLPEDKVGKLEELQAPLKDRWEKLLVMGDGINDAPVLARAAIGAAMGGLGSDAAIEAADIVITDDRPGKLVTAIEIARRTKRIVVQNIVLTLGIKVFFLILGAAGIATIWGAVFADVGVTLLAVLNAARALRPAVSRFQTVF